MLEQKFIFYGRIIFWVVLIGMIMLLLGLNYYVKITTNRHCYHTPIQVPLQPIAIVFGAGIWEDGTPTPMLADRIEGAIGLYKLGRVKKLLMTGDNSSEDYNEVKAMAQYAQARGVPAGNIVLDYAGFSTYESCYRAKEIFGIKQAVLVTQRYHLPRAVYTCEHLGINVVGLGMADWGQYPDSSMRYYSFRESFSTLKACWEVHITHPRPTFLGPIEKIQY